MRTRTAFLAILVALTLRNPRAGDAIASGRFPVWICSDGKGTISLFWLPPVGDWPTGGFRIERVAGQEQVVLADGLRPAQDDAAMAAIPPEEAAKIRDLDARIRAGTLSDEEKAHSILRMGRSAAIDPVYGRALGLRFADTSRLPGTRVYRLIAQDVGGRTLAETETGEIDPSRETEGPDRPGRVEARTNHGGVVLSWSDPPVSATAPVVAYRIDRAAGGGNPVALTRLPLAFGRLPGEAGPDYRDTLPPPGTVVYEIRAVDIFGRFSQPARATISVAQARPSVPSARSASESSAYPEAQATAMPLPANGAAPWHETAQAGPTEQPGEQPVNRTAQGVPSIEPSASDLAIPMERNESYRRRAGADPDSHEVPAAGAEPASPVAAEAPEIPAPLEPPLERNESYRQRAAPLRSEQDDRGDNEEAREDGTPAAGPGAADPAQDDGRPRPPRILSVAVAGSRVRIAFEPAPPAERSRGYRMLRSATPGSTGVLVGRPIPEEAREWEDAGVEAGQSYWYRIVAVDANGNQGDPSPPRWVAVGSP